MLDTALDCLGPRPRPQRPAFARVLLPTASVGPDSLCLHPAVPAPSCSLVRLPPSPALQTSTCMVPTRRLTTRPPGQRRSRPPSPGGMWTLERRSLASLRVGVLQVGVSVEAFEVQVFGDGLQLCGVGSSGRWARPCRLEGERLAQLDGWVNPNGPWCETTLV